jgi:hypothetical protein
MEIINTIGGVKFNVVYFLTSVLLVLQMQSFEIFIFTVARATMKTRPRSICCGIRGGSFFVDATTSKRTTSAPAIKMRRRPALFFTFSVHTLLLRIGSF